MENLTDGTMDEKVTAVILTAMAANGLPTAEEMAGCAGALLKKKTPFPLEKAAIETEAKVEGNGLAEIVGTGGDGKGSFNISSLSAVVAASCGQPVAKHGNRAVSSKSGAADFFENLGIKIMAEPEKTAELVKQTGFGFLMAPVYHSAMRFAAPVRKSLGIKTIFNVLGPLLNPAGAEYEVLGVYSADLLEDYARAAKALGAKRVMVIHSRDGFDEISPCEPTDVFQINEDGKEYRYVIDPVSFGIGSNGNIKVSTDELEGGNGADNAKLAIDVLNGKGRTTIKAAVGLNAGAVLYLSGKTKTLKEGYEMAIGAIENGTALRKLEEIQNVSCKINEKVCA
jgi:anthranilate synthase/phosphoribosyltransferase